MVLKKYLLTFALFLGTMVGVSQPDWIGDLNIIRQQQITEFNNGGFTGVTGNINIVGSPYSDQSDPPIDITFPNLTNVSDIVISCETAEVINFPELTKVDGRLIISTDNNNNNSPLETVDFPKLKTISSEISVSGNFNLIDFILPSLEKITSGHIYFRNNPALESVEFPELNYD